MGLTAPKSNEYIIKLKQNEYKTLEQKVCKEQKVHKEATAFKHLLIETHEEI